jgi:restriction system protein
MSIPDYQSVMLPLLKIAGDGQIHRIRDSMKSLADEFKLSEAERKELLPSGQPLFNNRVGWARTSLKKAGLIEYPTRGNFTITSRGQEVISENPPKIDVAFLKRYPEFVEFWTGKKISDGPEPAAPLGGVEASKASPEDSVRDEYKKFRKLVEANLLAAVKSRDDVFFESLVLKLLTKMGYGDSIPEAAQRIGRTGDGGIDGVIKQDPLGLDWVYIQAKRWDATSVGRPEIQKFVGALHDKANKGVFITTSTFSQEAKDYAQGLGNIKVVLVDGQLLAELMFKHDLGVVADSPEEFFALKHIDSDFFEEAEPLGHQ